MFYTVSSRLTNTSTRLYEVSGLDVRFSDGPSQPSCLPNMPRPFSESVLSESHDVNDMQLQVAWAEPNGPRAPLRPNSDDPHGWEPTESPVDQLSFPTSVAGQTGDIHRMDSVACRPTVKCRKTMCVLGVRHMRWNMDTKLGRRQPRARFAGRLSLAQRHSVRFQQL